MLELIILSIILIAIIIKFPRISAWVVLVWATGIASFIYGPDDGLAFGTVGLVIVGGWQLQSCGERYRDRKEAELDAEIEAEVKAEAEQTRFKEAVKEAVKEATAETVK